MSLRRKLIAGFVVISLLVGIVGFLGLTVTKRVYKSFGGGEEHYRAIVSSATEVSHLAKEAESHSLTFLITQDPQRRENAYTVLSALRGQAGVLSEKVKAPKGRELVVEISSETDKLESAIGSLMTTFDEDMKNAGSFDYATHASLLRGTNETASKVRENAIRLARLETNFLNRQEAVTAATEAASYARRASTHLILYLTTHDPADRDRFFKRHVSLREQIAVLHERTVTREGARSVKTMKEQADRLFSIGTALLGAYDEDMRQTGRFDPARHAALAEEFDDSSDRIAEEGTILAKEHVAIESGPREAAVQSGISLQRTVVTVFVAAVFISLVLGYSIARTISRPLMTLRDAAATIGRGDLDTRIEIGSKDEVGELARSFNAMAEDLRRSRTELVAANDALERRVWERTAELTETNERLQADIEMRTRAEEALRESEERYRTLIETMNDGLAVLDQQGVLTYVNDRVCEISGYSRDEVIGRPALDFVHEDMKQIYKDQLVKRKEGIWDPYELQWVKKDGRRVDTIVSPRPLFGKDHEFKGSFGIVTDITKLKEVEEALRSSEAKYRIVADNTYDWEFWVSPDCRFIYSSPSCKRITGYDTNDFFADPDLFYRIVHPDDRHLFDSHRQKAAEKTACDETAFRIVTADGSVRWISHVCQPVYDGDGTFLGTRGSHRDITDRVAAEKAVRESEVKYRALMEDAADAILLTDTSGRLLEANKRAEELLGYTKEEMLGMEIKPLMPAEEMSAPIFSGLVGKGIRSFSDGRLVRKDGRIVPVDLTTRVIRYAGKEVIQAIFRDITERKQAEEALRQSENKFRMLVENLPQKIFLKDRNSIYVYCNDSYANDLNRNPGEVIGMTDYDLYPAKSAEKHLVEDRRVMATRKPEEKQERYIKDGREVLIRVFKTPLLDEKGAVTGLLGIIWDVTEKMRLESIAEAVNTMDNIGYVFSGIRHEIGNPINSLKITLSVLKNKLDLYPKETVMEYIDRAMGEISRVEYLLRALKSFNMYENPEIQRLDMITFIEKFVTLVYSDAAKRGIMLSHTVEPGAEWAQADPRALQQVLLNILSNAMDALEGRDQPMIRISVSRIEETVRIRIVDNGCGMPEEQQSQLFKPFRTTKARGTGLGLVIAKKMLAKMRSTISMFSHQGEGTIVDVSLSAAPEDRDDHQDHA